MKAKRPRSVNGALAEWPKALDARAQARGVAAAEAKRERSAV